MPSKYFPIHTETACPLKWSWSTLYLNSGVTNSCHRTGESELTPENFFDFHNTPVKIKDRQAMLAGQWPEENCSYCRNIEQLGHVSDRMRQLTLSNPYPSMLDHDSSAVAVEPTQLEVYFNNTCNLGCVYCNSQLSSTIAAENQRHGRFEHMGVVIEPTTGHYKDLLPSFWQWFATGFNKLDRLYVLGGEPFYQKEFEQLLDYIEENPNPNCVFSVVTNLMLDRGRLEYFIERFRTLLARKKLKRIDLTCSIDCWGPQQEYVRWGMKLDHWQENFEYVLKQRWLYININQVVSVLTVKTMPELLKRLAHWRQSRHIGHWFSGITPGPSWMKTEIFGSKLFAEDAQAVLNLMPTVTEEDQTAYDYMKGLLCPTNSVDIDVKEVAKLIVYLDEKDRRRSTNWETVFPWLVEYRKYVV